MKWLDRRRQLRREVEHELELAFEALELVRDLPYPASFIWEKPQRIEGLRITAKEGDVVVGEIADWMADIRGEPGDTLQVTLSVALTIDGEESDMGDMVLIPKEEMRKIADTVNAFRSWAVYEEDEEDDDAI